MGEPPPSVKWVWRDDIPLQNSERIKIENSDYHTDFTILNAVRKDTGRYTLTIENVNGKDTETVELTVLSKPGAPKGPLTVTDVTAEKATVNFKKPDDDGGVPIREYEIEKMDMATGKWVRVGRVPASKLTPDGKGDFEVTGLTPGSEYKFRVTAVNDEGDSEPLVSDAPIVAKNPFGKFIDQYSTFHKTNSNLFTTLSNCTTLIL